MSSIQNLAAPLGRLLLSLVFLLSGVGKMTNYAGTQGFMESVGLPGMLLPLAIVVEAGCALLVIIGWQTRHAALLLALFSIATAVIFHRDFSQMNEMYAFMKNLGLAGGFLILYSRGPGAFALDKA
ncbi:MAG: DoxX family protein [Shewanellaceae bacterium]|nr:DoxX family protein [Shewanellaceae bacterium]